MVISTSDFLVMHSALAKLQKGFGNNKLLMAECTKMMEMELIETDLKYIVKWISSFVNVDVSSTEAECLLKYVRMMKLDGSARHISLVPPPSGRKMEEWIFNLKTLDEKIMSSRFPSLSKPQAAFKSDKNITVARPQPLPLISEHISMSYESYFHDSDDWSVASYDSSTSDGSSLFPSPARRDHRLPQLDSCHSRFTKRIIF
jgi:hypothetical protein